MITNCTILAYPAFAGADIRLDTSSLTCTLECSNGINDLHFNVSHGIPISSRCTSSKIGPKSGISDRP